MQPDPTSSPADNAAAVCAAPPCLPRLSRRLRLQYESAQSRWVLLYPEGMVQLNDSAAEILRRCDGRHSVADIVRELEALFDTQGIAVQVQSLIDEGIHRGWID
ncbi:pyrroloquinoline quinone biosynthesis peptide chaperone PqqD [Comamonas faecalis]|uniref:Pyrroloquinoline quinone biosynthesis peptide chaperone PqqD n=1 Tax=Comamonas faecalis TaxID=1387849 RepID=A0ABP7RXF2_9BURK